MADDSNPFAAPTKFTDVVLIVEDKKIHVSKQFLAIHSPVFDAMFFREFAEKEKEEVKIKDVVFKEFIDVLKVIHPGCAPITDSTVSYILKLADRFQIKKAQFLRLFQCWNFSEFIIRWEIDNLTATLATGKAESTEFNEGGYRWVAGVKKSNDKTQFELRCDADNGNGQWKCEAEVELLLLRGTSAWLIVAKKRVRFDESGSAWLHKGGLLWSSLTHPWYNVNEKLSVKFRIHIINEESPIFDPTKFLVPTSKSNVILLIGEVKLHVSKEILAIHSPVFDAMFFGNFAEKNKDEVEIKDVIYEDFIDLLHVIYPGGIMVSDSNVDHILILADRFQMKLVLDLVEAHLRRSKKFTTVDKLRLADQYRLIELRDHCLKSFSNSRELRDIGQAPEHLNFSDGMKAAICDRLMKLLPAGLGELSNNNEYRLKPVFGFKPA